ncbi:peroxidase family protein [Nitrosomonas sp. Nm33]|uniref:peroxidase family protein n=1 Tax=Nitrosomonas sp. Nm33 TaxID=133724 RepID=UPI0008993D7F|nr:peroxidase family protein [Nitrosomonas sp. Nm33]SDY45461.1 Ca2+-binding protein, RTX toxin-related [Nitrosomonas sp. Nm33]
MANFNKADLEFILKQIKIAEAHPDGNVPIGFGADQISSPMLPYGLRTVDGSYNNLVPGQSEFGAADNVFPRITPPDFRSAETLPFDPDGPGPLQIGDPTSYTQTSGIVVDSQPRIISNLIADQSANNPAAVEAAGPTPVVSDNGTLFIPNVAPDVGLSARFNSWFTLFGQFFDHGLDLVTKGNSGIVFVPLQPDDPLFVPGSPTNFMVLSRATNQPGPDGVIGTADDIHAHTNTTTPFVDQNQTYTSHPSHQVFLREYALVNGKPVATGRLLDHAGGGLPTWADVKAQAQTMLGITLRDQDILNIPLLATDAYGHFLRGPNGFAQIVTENGLVEGNAGGLTVPANAIRTGHAFLDDIAHSAVPFGDHDNNPATPQRALTPDTNKTAGVDDNNPSTYDNELLNAHYITGDGRGNENIGLTSVHHVFHSEHNRLVDQAMSVIESSGDAAFIAEWKLPNGDWNGERLFQAARFGTEMQYQHLVFEEFARKVQPEVNAFAGYSDDIDPAIVGEFAHAVYRFGHTMLTDTMARINPDGTHDDIPLIEAFLNPLAFASSGTDAREAAGAIVRGMTNQIGNEIDEFVTGAVRNNLLGLPLDLATINLARGRETGLPKLNDAREQFFTATNDAALKPYGSWAEFKLGITNPLSLVNFIAAYGIHPDLQAASTLADKRAVALSLYDGSHPDSVAFLNGDAAATGVNNIDLWIGGLAEKIMLFGGMLGSTFNFVFETQLEKLQDGDRFYYLGRTAGLHFLTELENNSFAELIIKNVDGVKHLPGDVFSHPDYSFEIGNLGTSGPIVDDPNTVDYDESALPSGSLIRMNDGTVRFTGEEHIMMGGTEGNDRMHAGNGDDTLWGDGGIDRLEGGAGNDIIHGGDGDDIITDEFGTDNIKGEGGNDVISAGAGVGDLILGGDGNDFVVGGADPKEIFGGAGNDFIIAGNSTDTVLGGEDDDWIEGGDQADLLQGDNADPFQVSPIIGNDVIIGDGGDDDYDAESGDDIMVSGAGIERNEGMLGFDWVTARLDSSEGVTVGQDFDLLRLGLLSPDLDAIRDRFDMVEALSGWNNDDVLRGDNRDATLMIGHELNNIGLISGLQQLLDDAHRGVKQTSFTGGNILLGGGGSDIIEGRGGNDIIHGDKWLNVRLSVVDANNNEIQSTNSMTELQSQMFSGEINPSQIRIVREILPTTPGVNDIDTVVFSGNRAEYTISPLSTRLMTVTHTGGTQIDGSDILMGVERLQFADQTIALVPLPNNSPATGMITINDTTPGENQELLATTNFNDPDGVNNATIVLTWQAEFTPGAWTPVGTGQIFTPSDLMLNAPLRVVATFQDNKGASEQIISGATVPVVSANGVPVINDTTPREGMKLSTSVANITDPNGVVGVTFNYQWQVGGGLIWTNITGATGANFRPTQSQVGQQLRVLVSYTDNAGNAEQLASAPTAVVGDLFIGTIGNDIFNGTEGDDYANGGKGVDTLNGNGGDDKLKGGFGNDTINGGSGNDTIDGKGGNDTINSGVGDDVILAGISSGFDAIDGGDGSDRLQVTANNVVIGLSSLAGIEEISSGSFTGVRIAGTSAANTLDFSATTLTGITSISGNGGNDILIGSTGNDTINGGAGNDTINGGAGDDVILVPGTSGFDTIDGGVGSDQIQATANDVVIGLSSLAGVEEISSGGFTGVRIAGTSAADTLDFSATTLTGITSISGNGGNDILTGSAGNDTINGGWGRDTITGGAGDDFLNGGTGFDSFVFNTAGFGNDTIGGGATELFDAIGGTASTQDLIDLRGLGLTFTDLTITQVGTDTLITIGADSITLLGVKAAKIDSTDFISQ